MIEKNIASIVSNRVGRKDINSLLRMYIDGERIAMLTCYDSSFAALMDRCGVDILFVGDSLGNVCQGHASTLPVTLGHMVYHTKCVSRGNSSAFLIADMPYGTYATPGSAIDHAAKLMQAGAQMVKLEGGAWLRDIVSRLVERGIPVCAHVGLTPQYVHSLGGYKVQGKTIEAAKLIKDDALVLQNAGAKLVVIEAVPKLISKEITEALSIPAIGIGAGPYCSGQVLVMHDMLGISSGRKARFVKNFMDGCQSIEAAIRSYVEEVKSNAFPNDTHCY
ncbi:3-methyl-2-oxobutanoate hydroxymethyltransferase [Noviherbaspirillum saxi]|uniref:3-methyl-2-oxobutanoate hydroxymethyltransferase n=1 Tax=Noviherbaspirillum saxi TaxID=2320863 RepID=A0A3A3FJ45_9BURK|nr:3-methyl-2-oxobutanoate hydroxymethyltransferase [Noviherbaspirillum saxi]RJF95513.1 3-methyl-2-oxobutanoate hydroxymethyltransferase [Noviherbaspirillum saxi]